MLRSRKQPSSGNSNGSSTLHSSGSRNGHSSNNGNDLRGLRSKKSFIPKPLIGTLIVASILCFILLLSGSLSNNNSSINGSSITHENHEQLRNTEIIQSSNVDDKAFKSAKNHTAATNSPTTGATLHIIFSTDCGTFQHWQSYLFFHRAYTIQQPGYITRIASGCTEQQMTYEKLWHQRHISTTMSDRFRIHFTPHFSGVKDETTGEIKGDYKYFNKPFGLKHFLENDELLGFEDSSNSNNNNEGKRMKHPNDIIILCDPDFALLKPITDDFSNTNDTLVGPRRKAHFKQLTSHIVTHGQPYAQTYGLGTQWRKFNLDEIAGVDSPAKEVSQKDGGMFYPAGPPYIGTAVDMYKIAVAWSEFAPRVHKEYPHLLAEMYAYCIAAAHLRLPHILIDSLMISNPGINGEGWLHITHIPPSETCSNPDDYTRPLPTLLHYCQRYKLDGYFWGKRKIPHEIFSCDHPLFEEPPMELGTGTGHTSKDRMNAFIICAMTRFVNDAMVFFKEGHCEGGGNRERKALVPFVDLRNKKG